jgi:hypothetical protein
MELVFVLITYLGTAKIDQSYFRSIDNCLYYATRVNSNVTIPTIQQGTPRKYTAVCEPRKINIKKEKVY